MAKETPDKDFLEFIIKALVDNPDDVKVDRKVDEMGVLLSFLVRIVGLKNHARVNLKIEEPAGGRGPRAQASEGLEDLKL